MSNGINPRILGGGYQGISPMQTISSQRDSSDVMARRKLRDAVNKKYMSPTINNYGRVISPFKAVMGYGHYRDNLYYIDGTEPNQIATTVNGLYFAGLNRGSTIAQRDGTGIISESGRRDYIASGAEYSNFKKLMAVNSTYNDISFVGDDNNGSYVASMAGFYGQSGFMGGR
jgi:hypothetical protein